MKTFTFSQDECPHPHAAIQMTFKGVIAAAAGVAIGLAASTGLTELLESYLFEVDPAESSTYATVVVLGLALALAASWLPAQRAARGDPMAALRQE